MHQRCTDSCNFSRVFCTHLEIEFTESLLIKVRVWISIKVYWIFHSISAFSTTDTSHLCNFSTLSKWLLEAQVVDFYFFSSSTEAASATIAVSLRSFIGKLSKGKFMFIVCLIFLPRHHSGRKHDEKLTVGVDAAEGKVSYLSLKWKYFLPIFKNDEMAFITSPASKLAQTSGIK